MTPSPLPTTSAAMRRLALLIFLALAASSPPPQIAATVIPLDTDDPARETAGRLRYQGGLHLTSSDKRMGGLSGMRFLADGRLLAITDAGDWLTLTLTERADRLTGVAMLAITRQPGRDGRPLRAKSDADAEALELDTDGTPYVAYERDHRVIRFPIGEDRPRAVPFPDAGWLGALPPNAGLEAIARLGDAWLFLAEEPGPASPQNGVLLARSAPAAAYGRLTYTAPPGFKPTDAAALDDDHALILNRRYSPMMGVAAALTLVAVDRTKLTIGPPETLAELRAPMSVDNMEALAIRRVGPRTFIYMASDDNFSPLQRTLLMKFELLPAR